MLQDTITLLPGSFIIGEREEKTLNMPGELAVITGTARWYPAQPLTIINIQAHASTPPVGASILIDIKKNGTTILVAPISIAVNTNSSSIITNTTSMVVGDYLTADITQVGSTTPGSDLSIQFLYKNT